MTSAMKTADGDRREEHLDTTSSQTVGPYLHIGMTWLVTDDLTAPGVSGERYVIEGRVVDADGQPVDDAVLEFWQANAFGRYNHPEDTREDAALEPAFQGFGRVPTDAQGRYRLTTIKPGRVPTPDGALQAPHIEVAIFMRGLLKQLVTRVYFPDAANATDPVLASVPAERRDTLIARPIGDRVLEWNVVLNGEGETVFFEL
jgi:protocatechuate 3,4-dioxygenase alpha subunit